MEQFGDFQRGVISLSGISYFVMIAVVMLYISMVLIGRRHWEWPRGWRVDVGPLHAAGAGAAGTWLPDQSVSVASQQPARRHDEREAQLALAESTVKLVQDLRDNSKIKTIRIDAYVSPQVPAEYAAHKLNLLSTLSELSSLSGGKIVVDVHQIENFSEDATLAERTYGIEPHDVSLRSIRELERGKRFTSERRLRRASIRS